MRAEDEKWAESLTADAEALEAAIKREERRGRMLRAMEVSEVQQVLTTNSHIFSRVIHARKRLIDLLDTKGRITGGSGGSGGTAHYVIKHKQEGHIPDNLVMMYEALWIKTYGSGAGYIGDPNSLTPDKAGGNQMKMAGSDERVHRGVAKSGRAGSNAARKTIIKDERAFEFKRKMDKRMRRMASEIEEWIRSSKVMGVDVTEGGSGEVSVPRCEGCQSFVDREWRFCARCGVRRTT